MIRTGGIAVVVVAAATTACGLLLLGGVAPAPAGAQLAGDPVPEAEAIDDDSTIASTTTPTTTSTTTTTIPPTTSTMPPLTGPLTSPVPLSVSPTSIAVGVGGTARISGTCPTGDGDALGPVQIWEIGTSLSVIRTGVTAASWSYDWTAPSVVEPLVLQVWCGDAAGYQGGYPEALQIGVTFVAQEAPPVVATTTTTAAPAPVIPETD